MKVILLETVKNVGKKGQVVEVSDGYARNFLFPRKLAVSASEKSLEVLSEQKQHEKELADQKKETAIKLKAEVEKITLTFTAKTGEDGRLFGSISTKQIADEFSNKYNITVDKRKITGGPVTSLGTTKCSVELHKEVTATFAVAVKQEK